MSISQRWKQGSRSTVYSSGGMVSSSQPLASQIGARVLEDGGNAADATVAMAAAMALLQPLSNGIGGDAFALYWPADTDDACADDTGTDACRDTTDDACGGDSSPSAAQERRPVGIDASGRSPALLTRDSQRGKQRIGWNDVNSCTVPGAVSGWCLLNERFGSRSMSELLQPAIQLARKGAPISQITAALWANGVHKLQHWHQGAEGGVSELLRPNGQPPGQGEVWKNEALASVFEAIADEGASGFYEGRVAQAIVDAVAKHGGVMSLEDLKNHTADIVEPVSVTYRDQVEVWEIPPAGQGITALIALNIYEQIFDGRSEHNGSEHIHAVTESLRCAFADAREFISDPKYDNDYERRLKRLLSKEYAKERAALLSPKQRSSHIEMGNPLDSSDTIYLCVIDQFGNGCSFIQSNYAGFGTGLVPEGCGFTLQNRGSGFSLDPDHSNCLAPNKRPFHTIIPGMLTKQSQIYGVFGVMGGYMQPQGHLQVVSNLIDYGMDPQMALDAHRVCLSSAGQREDPEKPALLHVEPGIGDLAKLRSKGHRVKVISGLKRTEFGRGHVILRNAETGVLSGGADPRSDGCCSPVVL